MVLGVLSGCGARSVVSVDGAVRASRHHRRHCRMSYSPVIAGGVPLRLASSINTSATGSNDSNLWGTPLPARQSLIRCILTSGARGLRCRCNAVAMAATFFSGGLPAHSNNSNNASTNSARGSDSGAPSQVSSEIAPQPPHNTNVVNRDHASVDSLRHGRALANTSATKASHRTAFRRILIPQRKTRT
jgi:hypothetical protein